MFNVKSIGECFSEPLFALTNFTVLLTFQVFFTSVQRDLSLYQRTPKTKPLQLSFQDNKNQLYIL